MKFRQVHLDFHTSEKIDGIGKKFNKKQFQDALLKGHVDSITLFSKCHHGWSYHPTKVNRMHPGLSFDLLGAQIEAAKEIGVRTPVYISAGVDEKYVRSHPEHRNERRDHRFDNFEGAWYNLICMNTPYLDMLLDEIKEVCENYDADGIFLDIVGVRPCCCPACLKDMLARGKNPNDDNDIIEQAEIVYNNYLKRVREAIDSVKPGLPVFHNGGHVRLGRRDLALCNSHIEIESLPTGGWGYDHFPLAAKYVQNLDVEYLGMTGKFHTSWGEFGGFKHPNAIRYEVALSAAMGAKCSIGDQLAPDGEMDMTTYELIGAGYSELEKIEEWCDGVTHVTDVGLFACEAFDNLTADDPDGEKSAPGGAMVTASDAGASRILLEGKYQFSVIDFDCDFSKYKVIILPDSIRYSARLYDKLNEFVKGGGKILATGSSGIRGGEFAFDFGAKYSGKSEYTPSYVRLADDKNGSDYIMYTPHHVAIAEGGQVLAKAIKPYFNRGGAFFCSHKHTPSSKIAEGEGIVLGKDGAYIAWNVFDDYAQNGELIAKRLVHTALDALLGDEKALKTNLGSMGVATLMKQPSRYVAHLLYAVPTKRGKDIEIIEDIYPVHNVSLELKINEAVKKAYLAPSGEEIAFTQSGSTVKVDGITVDCHQMIVFDV